MQTKTALSSSRIPPIVYAELGFAILLVVEPCPQSFSREFYSGLRTKLPDLAIAIDLLRWSLPNLLGPLARSLQSSPQQHNLCEHS